MKNKRVLIIGGTGSVGKTLIRLYQTDNQIRVFSRDEQKQVTLLNADWINKKSVSFVIGDVKDRESLVYAIETYKPHVIINTAALKHVPVCEANPIESVKVNILGHQNLIEAIQRANHRIEVVIFVSTDKACKPINVYGMCKSISERLYIEYAKKQTEVKVCLVRFGNILESNGSVIPFFKQLLKDKATSLPITDDRMTRFLISLEQSVALINWAYENPRSHGKIAVPKLESFLITDIAKVLTNHYMGDESAIPTHRIGVRKGEKLHEELISAEEWMRTEEEENFLIGDEIIRSDAKSYNSLDVKMDKDKMYEYFKQCGVI